ncbi:hypothetical protein C5167_007606 [Papaver somniferum]|nr:hypothetical protein C5167_007606 [Papaver somniferum]
MASEKDTTSLPAHNQNEDHVTITGAAAPVPLPRKAGGNHHQSSSKSAGVSDSPASKIITTRTDHNNQKDLKCSSEASIFPEHATATGEHHSVTTDAVEEAHPHGETTPDENHGSEAAAAPQHGTIEGHNEEEHHEAAESPLSSRKLANHRHHHYHPSEKSVAGGGVILGGLATTFLVSIACYIRATRRNKNNNKINFISDREKDPQESTSPWINTLNSLPSNPIA